MKGLKNGLILVLFNCDSARYEFKESKHRNSLFPLCSSKNRKVFHHHCRTQQIRSGSSPSRTELWASSARTRSQQSCQPMWPGGCCSPAAPCSTSGRTPTFLLITLRWRQCWTAAWETWLEYWTGCICDKPIRLVVILVCSINNIGDGQAPEDIIEEMKEMKELVEDHSKLYRHYPQSTVSIATCIQPPKFSSFHLPPNATDLGHWILPITFLNRAEQISSLNKMIKELYGIKYFKSGTLSSTSLTPRPAPTPLVRIRSLRTRSIIFYHSINFANIFYEMLVLNKFKGLMIPLEVCCVC